MKPGLCFFEDSRIVRFYPNALTRPMDQFRMGVLTLAEKWVLLLADVADGGHQTRTLRPWLHEVFPSGRPEGDRDWIWINSRFVPSHRIVSEIAALNPGVGLVFDGVPVVARTDSSRAKLLHEAHQRQINAFFNKSDDSRHRFVLEPHAFDDVKFTETESGFLLEHAWDLFHHNAAQIEADIRLLRPSRTLNHVAVRNFFYVNADAVFPGSNVRLDPGIVLDASEGPIWLGDGVHVMAGALIKGPVAICEGSTVRMGAKIYGGTTAGPHCKLGGEVSTAIFQSYSNKAHDGYIGNSLIGEWVNIGADTNNSNLKNNYTTVRVYDWESGELKDSGLQFCGLFMADHCKTAINSMLNSGTVCGVNSSILTNNFPPKYIPSFGWVTDISIDVFELGKALETARTVMSRRGVHLSEAYARMLGYLFGVRDGRV